MGMEEKEKTEAGLTTEEALNRLYLDIEQILHQFQFSQRARKSKSWIRDALHHSSQYTTLNWVSIVCLFAVATLLVIAYAINSYSILLMCQSVFILILLGVGMFIELYDNKLRHKELPRRVQSILNVIKQNKHDIQWANENYPRLLEPFSPCITLQWTYRDGRIVNLPWALLVKDDIILVRPGQVSPGYCESLDKHSDYPLLHAKEVYGPSLQSANEFFSTPKSRRPLENKKYKLLETPFLNNLRVALEQALDRPVTHHNQHRHFVMVKVIQQCVLPLMLLLIFIVNIVRFIYLEKYVGSYWVDLFILVPISTVLPLLPLLFPVVWNGLNCLGMARFKTLFDLTTRAQIELDLFEDHDTVLLNHPELKFRRRDVLKNFLLILKGNGTIMARSANILHVLGSVTALCCVDKKGILSWPNPTAEKILFLNNSDNVSQTSSLANLGDLAADADSLPGGNPHHYHHGEGHSAVAAEVLDLTHDHNDPFKLHFDDTEWKRHISSLKPLGLAILLNTCNLNTQEHYTEFCSHITCEAMYNENLVPVTNRRCLCELAKEIGFVDEVQKVFSLEQQLSTFRHLQPEMVRRDNKYARSLHLSTKLKFPFPHMFAVVIKELTTGSMQLLSQGTADIILDSCVDFWDGHDLCPLTHSDRKKVQDFYQRSSLTAYCTAFAYRPLPKGVSDKMSKIYLELPSDSRHLYLSHRSPTPIHWECRSVLEPKIRTPLGQFYSTDSLLYNDSPTSDVSDTESCFDIQCNQVFIGMVTMQYQAQSDMVHLIEQLENACIRFVHFSKENELRSRVFSEKMGLESGWNCHISLLSERSRRDSGPTECWANNGTARVSSPTDLPRRVKRNYRSPDDNTISDYHHSNVDSSKALSYSAPSAINLEHSVVKFDMEHAQIVRTISKDHGDEETHFATSQDSVHIGDLNSTSHEWQSLSCLTDSTEQSAPINFDMSNRAKLPRGIDKIRPHIENIDNVPLLVSLFTDCTATTTKEMLHIMQEYGEVICVMGSSANYENIGIFMQADASIAVEPLYPQMCQKAQAMAPVEQGEISPIELSRMLNSIACSLSIKREDPISIYHLIMEARHYMNLFWNAVQFWLCCCVTLSLMQLIASICMLPALLTPGQVLWTSCINVPLLSISLIGNPIDQNVMKKPQDKKQVVFNSEVALFVSWCYGAKFLPMIVAVIVSFCGTLASYCADICHVKNCTCFLFYLPIDQQNSTVVGGWSEHGYSLFSAQNLMVILILFHFVTISIGFIHREHTICSKSPHRNVLWLAAIILLFVLQTGYTLFNIYQNSREYENDEGYHTATIVLVLSLLSPIVTFACNELVKRHEIKVNLRFQKRARLDFGTKLGMNSPF